MLINIKISMADYSELISCFWILYSTCIHFVTQLFFMSPVKLHLLTLNPPIDVCNSSNTILLFLKCIAIHKQIRYLFASMIKLEPGDIQETSKHSFWVLTTEIKSAHLSQFWQSWQDLKKINYFAWPQVLSIFIYISGKD
jgi:hypothetical protein